MRNDAPVSTIMTKNTITLDLKDDLLKAEHFFKKYNIMHIPVIRNSKIKGILSYSDLLRMSFADAIDEDSEVIDGEGEIVDTAVYSLFTLEQLMVKKIVTVSPETSISEVAEILAENEFHALPVCEGKKLVGIVTTTDLIRYLIKRQ